MSMLTLRIAQSSVQRKSLKYVRLNDERPAAEKHHDDGGTARRRRAHELRLRHRQVERVAAALDVGLLARAHQHDVAAAQAGAPPVRSRRAKSVAKRLGVKMLGIRPDSAHPIKERCAEGEGVA
eukprot:6203991-Pleurochrysis_carterae.AAC.2